MRDEIREVRALMEREGYVTDRAAATAVYLATTLRKPLLVEGRPGVGKTEIAKVLASALGAPLIRLQCYEGLDASTALYEWNYPKQLLHVRLDEGSTRSLAEREASIFGREFLLERPLLRAITQPDRAPVLLVDEIDRSDEEFEAFLLEILSEYQVTIPEIGTVRATHEPYVVLTSNRARELSEALRRRCLYLWVDYPTLEKELRVVRSKVPAIGDALALEVTRFVQALRGRALLKTPGVAESLDWARALVALGAARLDAELVDETMGCFLKDEADLRAVRPELETRVAAARGGADE
ncbi:ATPase associated with various cellular activities AAA_5 [Gemmatirosa kalamazoonensis]|uniref:ATPase associated with various cellular activities AAA_5 n=1 Tax=Gemmatirosa kalamazoonensis TaxID=861299 RepID=W0RHB3_9BACT|nr:MoxR family ATPase [Gemmatirosa kalamazoonensis]AHG89700.1 ATPase associated with various cellular activities AAA_5 [Gemmatirosa kalamazoonensis]